jgi:UDP-glucuronate decarboxylase
MHTNDGRVVSGFIVRALKNEDIAVFGDGSQTRSFCYVDDLIDGLVRMMASGDDFVGPVNMGSTCEFTMNELAAKVIALTGSTSKVVHETLPEDDPAQRRPDLTLARERLGWEPTICLDEGLRRTIDCFRDTLGL